MLIAGLMLGFAANPAARAADVQQFDGSAPPPRQPLSLWYRRPARKWLQALAIGNGRIGAMVFGGVNQERLQLSDDTLWAGRPYDPVNPEAKAALPEVRRLVFAGKYAAAQKLANEKLMAKPLHQMPYETVGNVLLNFPAVNKVENYRRDLSLDTAVARVEYTANGVHYTREAFASPVDHVIVLRLTANQPGKITFTAGMNTPQRATVAAAADHTLVMSGVNGSSEGIKGALKFEARVRVLAQGGKVSAGTSTITVNHANSATLLIASATSYKSYNNVSGHPAALTQATIAAASAKSFDALREASVAFHQKLFRRVSLNLGATAAAKLPTDERLRDFATDDDPSLVSLYFQFGRYLLISCSLPGGQPANLQGMWNDSMNPPWGGKYTININTEMNYWPAETCNLALCEKPLFAMIRDLSRTGAHTAREMYGAGGWVCHHNTDLWRATAPIDGAFWGLWPTGGAWLTTMLWQHYLFSGNKQFLARVYPIMKGASQFFADTLVEDPSNHWLVTCPSVSPEHAHQPGVSICVGPTMDEAIIRDLFGETAEAARILGKDEAFRRELLAKRARLAPYQIGKGGQLQEWLHDWDLSAPDIHHRHLSPLYGLFPGDQITPAEPKLFAAARKLLELRGDNGGMGWAQAWRAACWARLLDGNKAYYFIRSLIASWTESNMFDKPVAQLDGNFGGTAAIAEMLLQSRALAISGIHQCFEINFLPALPAAWPDGSVKGLCARGGFEVDETWQGGKLTEATVHSLVGNPVELRYGNKTRELHLKSGETFRWHLD